MGFSVLFVCTGNVCRSPAAEVLMRSGVGSHGVDVSSAGTSALVGEGMAPPMADLVRGLGADPEGFVARQLTPLILRSADVVVTMTRAHRTQVVMLAPAAVQKTYLLAEVGRMLQQVDPSEVMERTTQGATAADRLSAALALARRYRMLGTDPADDVVDPYGRSRHVYERALDQITRGLGPLIRFGSTPS